MDPERTLTDAVARLAELQAVASPPNPEWSSEEREHRGELARAERVVDALGASSESANLYEAGIRASQVRVREDAAQPASAQNRSDRIAAIERELATIERLRIQLLLERARLLAEE